MSKQLPTIANLSDPREAAFVAALFELGGPAYAPEAARRAGYARTQDEADRAAAILLDVPRIARAIVGEIRARLDVAALSAFNTLLEICASPKAPANARITAAQEILNRSSVGPIVSRSANLNANVGIEELLDKLDKRDAAQQSDAAGPVIDQGPLPE